MKVCPLCSKEFKTVTSLQKHSVAKRLCVSRDTYTRLLQVVDTLSHAGECPLCKTNVDSLKEHLMQCCKPLRATAFILQEEDSILTPFDKTYIEWSDDDYSMLRKASLSTDSLVRKFVVLRLSKQPNVKPSRGRYCLVYTDDGWFRQPKDTILEDLYTQYCDCIDKLSLRNPDIDQTTVSEKIFVYLSDYYKRF